MFVLRWMTGAAVTAAGCAALAGTADAKIFGSAGSFIAYDSGGDVRVMSDQGAGAVDVNITNSPAAVDGAPSWGLPEQQCLRVGAETNLAGGRTLVYESRPSGGDNDLVLAKLSGNPPSLVSSRNLTPGGSADEGAPAVGSVTDAPTQEDISVVVFARGPVGQRDIWAMFVDGSHETQLTSGSADESNPDWASRGGLFDSSNEAAESVVYQTTDAAGRQQLATIKVGYNSEVHSGVVALSAPQFITAGPEQHGDPSWYGASVSDGSDPSRVVHVVTGSGTTYLDFIEQGPPSAGALFAPGSVPAPMVRQLTGDPGGDLAPSWRPEGAAVVFESDRAEPGNRDIYRIGANGAGLVRLTQAAGAEHAPDWEPIGLSGVCLNPAPYSPRPGTQTRSGRPVGSPGGGSRPSGTGGPGGGSKASDTALRVSGLRVTTTRKGRRRVITARFSVNVPARGTLRLRRSRRTIARGASQLSAGRARMRLSVPRGARGGRYTLRLTVTAGSTTKRVDRRIRIGSLRSRR